MLEKFANIFRVPDLLSAAFILAALALLSTFLFK